MGFHGKRRSVSLVDRRMQERWERVQGRRLVDAMEANPDSGETHVSPDKMVHAGSKKDCQHCAAVMQNN